jgi:MinD-like ATPase involved in chromosome partitioning or flagellar assembly
MTGTVPEASTVVAASINEGEPFVLSRPDSAVAQSVRGLAARLTGRVQPAPPLPAPERRGWRNLLPARQNA